MIEYIYQNVSQHFRTIGESRLESSPDYSRFRGNIGFWRLVSLLPCFSPFYCALQAIGSFPRGAW